MLIQRLVRRAIKNSKVWKCVQIGSTLPTLYPQYSNRDKNKFGKILFCLPYQSTSQKSLDILELNFAYKFIFL